MQTTRNFNRNEYSQKFDTELYAGEKLSLFCKPIWNVPNYPHIILQVVNEMIYIKYVFKLPTFLMNYQSITENITGIELIIKLQVEAAEGNLKPFYKKIQMLVALIGSFPVHYQ